MKKILIVFVALIFSAYQVFGIGIGIAPNEITINDASRGTEYARTLTVFNPDESPNNFTLSVEGDASGWIRFHDLSGKPVENISIPGNNKQSLIIKINPPADEAVGTYNATIYAKTIPASSDSNSSVNAVLMANAFVVVQLTGQQILSGVVNMVKIDKDTEPGYPLRIGTTFKNTGNVIANPEISVSISKDGETISDFTYEGARIKPETTETVIAEWNTTAAESVGDYMANVVVSLDGNQLASDSVPFKVLPVGTLTRQGNFTNLVLVDEPVLGSAVKLNANFINTGSIDALAKFSGEVYKDGVRVDALASDEILVAPEKEASLVTYLKLSSPGSYQVKGRIVYSGKETEMKELSFTVPGSKTASFGNVYIIWAAVLLVFGGAIYLIRRKMRS